MNTTRLASVLLGLCIALLFGLCLIPGRKATRPYSQHDYVQDTTWCIDHGYEFRSDALYKPVTCLQGGLDVAVPPHSLNLASGVSK